MNYIHYRLLTLRLSLSQILHLFSKSSLNPALISRPLYWLLTERANPPIVLCIRP